MRTAFVINPKSAGGTTGADWDRLRLPLLEHFPDAKEYFTTCAGDATRATRLALREGARVVLGVGGDGTNNECINGFFDEDGEPINPDASYGFVPRGTGCDFARYLGIPRDLAAAAKVLAEAPTWPIDLGYLEVTTLDGGTARHYWLNIMDFGIGGLICSRVNQSSKRLGGFLSFLWHSIVGLMIYEDQAMELDVVGAESFRGVFRSVIIANGRYFGGGMNINPKAELDDGKLDLILLPDEGFFHYMKWFPRLYQDRGVLDHPGIPHRRVTQVTARAVDPDAEVFVEMDGENPGRLPLTVKVLPGALKLRAPYPGDRRGRG